MKKHIALLLLLAFITGCASQKDLDDESLIKDANSFLPVLNQMYYCMKAEEQGDYFVLLSETCQDKQMLKEGYKFQGSLETYSEKYSKDEALSVLKNAGIDLKKKFKTINRR